MLASCSSISGKYITRLATTTAISSASWILAGVPPRMYPTLKSCSSSPATEDETHTTAATPKTTATPCDPETPKETISSAAISNVESVRPDTGLFEDPMKPHKLPEIVAKKKPTISITSAAKIAGSVRPEMRM